MFGFCLFFSHFSYDLFLTFTNPKYTSQCLSETFIHISADIRKIPQRDDELNKAEKMAAYDA